MDPSQFDDLTKALATATSRRQALKTIAATTLAGLLGLSGIGTAFAKPPKCHRNGLGCDTNSQCCSGYCANGEKCTCPPAPACNSICPCPSGQTCLNGSCCPTSQACGSTCGCPSGSTCLNGACCPSNKACGSTCCPQGQLCQSGMCVQSTNWGCNCKDGTQQSICNATECNFDNYSVVCPSVCANHGGFIFISGVCESPGC